MIAEIQNGIYPDKSNDSYHSGPGLSSSGFKEFMRSPAHYRSYKTERRAPTAAMLLGTAVHAALFEPGLYFQAYAVAPEGADKRTAKYKDFVGSNLGKEVVSFEDSRVITEIVGAVRAHKVASKLLEGGRVEQSAYWTDPDTGLLLKCRPDYLREDGIIVDLKTSEDASYDGFQRAISRFKYHIQSAWYLRGISILLNEPLSEFVHLVVESKPPHSVAIYTLDDGSLDLAECQIKDHLLKFVECQNKNEWPGYPEEIQNISVPHWMFV